MSTGIATSVALVLYTATVLPCLWIALRPRKAAAIAMATGTAILALTLLQTGLFARQSLARTDVLDLAPSSRPTAECSRVLIYLKQQGILLEDPSRSGLVVRGELWDALPKPAQEAVMECALLIAAPDDNVEQLPVTRR